MSAPMALDNARRHLRMNKEEKAEVGVLPALLAWVVTIVMIGLLGAVVAGVGGWPHYLLATSLLLAVTIINFFTIMLQRLL